MKVITSLKGLDEETYVKLKNSGLFWVYFPDATGNYTTDTGNGLSTEDIVKKPNKEADKKKAKEHTGLSVNYYRLTVEEPTSEDIVPYTAECNDLIEALNMTYAEANVFKAIWRKCAERTLGLVKEGNNQVYDAEKMVFFSDRTLKIDLKRKTDK